MNIQKNKSIKGQGSIEFIILLSAVLIITAISITSYYLFSSSSLKTIKNENINFFSTFEYVNNTSIFLTLTNKANFKAFNLSVNTSNGIKIYNYTITYKGNSNFETYGLIGTSSLDYPSYSLKNICSLTYYNSSQKTIFSIVKSCSK